MNTFLKNLCVLVTRPAHQAENLCVQISKLGGQPILLPTIEIIPAEDLETLHQKIQQLVEHSFAIFLSPNAVLNVAPLIRIYWPLWPMQVKVVAIGIGTANALRQQQLPVDFYPPKQFNSEGLLALPVLHQVNGKKIILFRGEGGRELLTTILRERHAVLTEAIAYRRVLPKAFTDFVSIKEKIDIIICTSSTGLRNLIEIMGETSRAWLQNMPLLVISERTAVLANDLGFIKPPLIADNATDTAIVNALTIWQEKQHGTYTT